MRPAVPDLPADFLPPFDRRGSPANRRMQEMSEASVLTATANGIVARRFALG